MNAVKFTESFDACVGHAEFSPGAAVSHPRFGKGVVVSVDKTSYSIPMVTVKLADGEKIYRQLSEWKAA